MAASADYIGPLLLQVQGEFSDIRGRGRAMRGIEDEVARGGMGRIYLKGLAFGEAKSLIRRKLAGYMDLRYSKLAISLTYSRSIQVNIVGEVINPGSYQIAAINTAFNAPAIAAAAEINAAMM